MHDWHTTYHELLGVTAGERYLMGPGAGLRFSWLLDSFKDSPPSNATVHVVRQYLQAYILALIGSLLFPDKSGTGIQLFVLPLEEVGTISWDSPVQVCLYRELCEQHAQLVIKFLRPLSSYRYVQHDQQPPACCKIYYNNFLFNFFIDLAWENIHVGSVYTWASLRDRGYGEVEAL